METISSKQSIDENKGFFAALFDFSFSAFITTKIIKLLYGLAMIGAGIAALAIILGGFSNGVGSGLGALILAPILFLVYVSLARIWFELVIVIFRVAEHAKNIDEQTKQNLR